MFLKSLTLKGFKSFADATTLEFEPGVTVVVGPNGSGKSNVVDAVAWVLGAQGPRTLRSAKMEDVIFAGTPKRPALGRAEVALTIDNSAGLLPIDFTEVTITRTLFRSGESEYAINRVPCRLLDIQELLSDSGVGRQQHVIVSQGNLDSVLNSRSEDRRLIIEEAAGILKYRRRKEKAERRLESTEASLVRLQDLLREVRRQLRPLEKQAEAARRHGDLVAELAAVRRYLMGGELAAVEERLSAAARHRGELAGAEAAVRGALARLDAEVMAAEAQSEATLRSGRVDLADLVSRAEALTARAAGMVALLAERRRSLERALAAAVDQDVIASLEAEARTLADRLASTDQEATLLLPQADELARGEAELAEEVAASEERWRGSVPATDPAAEVRGELAALRSTLERGRAELGRLDARAAGTEQRATRLRAEVERQAAVVDETRRAAATLAEAAERARAVYAEADAAAEAAMEEQRQADADRHRWTAREEALAQALDQARARAGAERLAKVVGVVGTLMELVELDDGLEAAFEAAAGEVLSAVIVDGVASARRGLEELQRGSAAGAVMALPDLAAGRAGWPAREPDGGDRAGSSGLPAAARPLLGYVRAVLPGVRRLIEELLHDAVVVDGSWEQAVDLAVARPDLVVVTLSGDRFSRGLWRSGAGGSGATRGAVDEARQHAADARARAARAAPQVREARAVLEDARRRRSAAAAAVEANTSRGGSAEGARGRAEADLAEVRAELAGVSGQRLELVARLERDEARVAELESLLPALQQAAEEEAQRVAAERAARARLAQRTAEVAAMRRALEVRAAGLEERRTLTERRLREVEERLRRNAEERDQAEARRLGLELAARATGRLLAVVRERESELHDLAATVREARRNESESLRQQAEHLEQLRRQRGAAERELAELRERISRVELDDAEARVRLEGLTEAIRRDLDCEADAVRGAECPPLAPGTSATSRRAELERELRMLGPVNPLALEEHAALEERHSFLEAQLDDVRSARRELTKVIRAIDGEIVEVLGAAYADVADNFEKLFATLFPGGQGRLRLTDPERILETGIEIEARPVGKNVRRLSLLSGGERSLVAMAFLFAVFRSRPSPFYMMDEVEAALDDVNLHRFLDLLHEFRQESQLLVVSHQKRTMEAADCLYGVTMAPGGSSRVVSERIAASA